MSHLIAGQADVFSNARVKIYPNLDVLQVANAPISSITCTASFPASPVYYGFDRKYYMIFEAFPKIIAEF